MNNTNSSKITKRRIKVKQNFNKCNEIETSTLTSGHSPHKEQQQEEKQQKLKRKLKSKNGYKNFDIQKTEEDVVFAPKKHQQYPENMEKVGKKKLKLKENFYQGPDIQATFHLQQQQHGEEKVEKKLLQVKSNSDIKTGETVVANSPQKSQYENDIEFYHKKAYIFMKTLKRDYKRLALIYNSCINAEQERERRNEEEINQLKKIYNQMQVETTDIKRKRWCRYCESEATYLSSMGTNFYCSFECEKKQNDLVSAMEEIFKS